MTASRFSTSASKTGLGNVGFPGVFAVRGSSPEGDVDDEGVEINELGSVKYWKADKVSATWE